MSDEELAAGSWTIRTEFPEADDRAEFHLEAMIAATEALRFDPDLPGEAKRQTLQLIREEVDFLLQRYTQ